MDHSQSTGSAISVMNLEEFFRDSLQQALGRQHLSVDPQTEHYVVAVLTRFASAEAFHQGDDGRRLSRPLAMRLSEALGTEHPQSQRDRLRELGDFALFVAGFFSGSFSRKLVDVDYYIAMGGRAYGTVANSWRSSRRGQVLTPLFNELAVKFQRLVDVLNEIAEMARPATDADMLRQYEIWLKTGSPRAGRLLQQQGIVPVCVRAHA